MVTNCVPLLLDSILSIWRMVIGTGSANGFKVFVLDRSRFGRPAIELDLVDGGETVVPDLDDASMVFLQIRGDGWVGHSDRRPIVHGRRSEKTDVFAVQVREKPPLIPVALPGGNTTHGQLVNLDEAPFAVVVDDTLDGELSSLTVGAEYTVDDHSRPDSSWHLLISPEPQVW